MRHQHVKVRQLGSWEECHRAIDLIESDYRNFEGGLDRWDSGLETVLTDAAQKKIDQIHERSEELDAIEVLRRCRESLGRFWRRQIAEVWETGAYNLLPQMDLDREGPESDATVLQAIRNDFGPSWLAKVSLQN